MKLRFNPAIEKPKQEIERAKLITATVVANDKVQYAGKTYYIKDLSPKGYKMLYFYNKDAHGILKSETSQYTLIILASPYTGHNNIYKPVMPGLTVHGILINNEFDIHEIKHKEHGFVTS
jgi:hypothetical protein